MTKEFDISVIVTAHDETLVAGPTMRAAERSIGFAQSQGWRVEPIIALDCPTAQTAEWFSQAQFNQWDLHYYEAGDLGQVRNQSVQRARGRFVAFLDADDLFSENWLSHAATQVAKAEAEGRREIVHPELNWIFDKAQSVIAIPAQNDPLFVPEHFYFMNYYDSLCMTPRRAHLDHPYVTRDIPTGYSFQDWQFAVETMGAGWLHSVARETVIFKRRRDRSLVTESHARRAVVRPIPHLAIDRIKSLGRTETPPTHTPPKAPVATTNSATLHCGARFTQRLQTALHQRAEGRNEEACQRIAQAFDPAFYLALNADIYADPNMDLVAHYLRAGARENRDPSPLFSTHLYRARNADVAQSGENPFLHWLRCGRDENRLGAPFEKFEVLAQRLDLEPHIAERIWQEKHHDLRHRLMYGEIGQQVVRACQIDPLIGLVWPQAMRPRFAPFQSSPAVPRTAAICQMQAQAGHVRAQAVICVNRARWGGARRMEGHLAHTLSTKYGAQNVLLLTTDDAGPLPEGRLPHGVRHVDLAQAADTLVGHPRQRLFVEFLRSLRPEIVFNVNSRLFWESMPSFASILAKETSLIGCFLCHEHTDMGGVTGYPLRQVYRHIDHLTALCTDSEALRHELITHHCIPPTTQDKIHVLRAPVDLSIPMISMPYRPHQPTVFWAGRFDAQKRVDLLAEIATALPQLRFRAWGEQVLDTGPLPDFPPNVILEGTYQTFHDLPLSEADLWLYTSAWDGVPQVLLEIGMTGIPIVSTDVGGTAEALGIYAEMVPVTADASAYVKRIVSVLNNPMQARGKAIALRDWLVHGRTPQHYARALQTMTKSNVINAFPMRLSG